MYYGNTPLIPIPEDSEKGKIVVADTGYVYLQLGYAWNPDTRQPKYERKVIGKLDKYQPNKMYFNAYYESIFGVVDEVVTELKKKYGERELKIAGKVNFCITFGPFAAIEASCKKTGCLTPLKQAFSAHWKFILALSVHAIVEEETTAQAFPGWCFTNYCGMNRVVADTEISGLYKYISSHKGYIKAFFTLYWKEYGTIFPKSGVRAVGFDSTNQNYGGRGIDLAKLGHAKIDVGLPIINTAMIVDEETGIPLWYEHFDGSLLDKTQNPYSLKKVVSLGYKKLFVVYDRGYYSQEDVEALEKLKDIEFGILCPDGTNWVEDLIRKHGPEIKDRQEYYVADENVYGNVYEVQPFTENGNSKTYYAYLFYDSERASAERDTIHEIVAYYWSQAEKRKRYSEKMANDFAKQGIIVVKTPKDSETGKNFQLLEDTKMIQSLLDMKGFFVMISATKMYPSEAIRIIRKRDMAEKAYARLMNHFNLRTTGSHSKETYEGLMFMAFIALIGLAGFQYFEKKYLRASSSRTTATVMVELQKYMAIWNEQEQKWEPAYAMNKEQKEIFGNVDLTEGNVQAQLECMDFKSKHLPG